MTHRPAPLQVFIDAAARAFTAHTKDPEGARVVDAVFAALRHGGTASDTAPILLPVARRYLPQLTDPVRFDDPLLRDVAGAFAALSPQLTWTLRGGDWDHANASFAQGHANVMIVGPGGLERRTDVWLGVSLLAPDVLYPEHTHPPEESYLALSPGGFRNAQCDWQEPGIGGTFYNPPGIVHLMRSGPEPFLAIWALRPETP